MRIYNIIHVDKTKKIFLFNICFGGDRSRRPPRKCFFCFCFCFFHFLFLLFSFLFFFPFFLLDQTNSLDDEHVRMSKAWDSVVCTTQAPIV